MEYADYHHAMAQHAAALSNNNQLHPAMAQIPMLSGLNLTVMPGTLSTHGNQQQLGQMHTGQHVMYHNVQTQQVSHHQQQAQPQQQQQNHQQNHHGGHQSHHGGGGGGGNQSTGKKSKKPKPQVNKDGVPAPKRATTAYINFTQWYREELKKSGRPIPKIGDFGKECASKWNSMPEDEKKPFLEVAERDRDRYKREMAIYKPARDANKPKRPGTAFMLFMGDFRKEMAGKEPEGGVAALAKLGGERWRGMTDESKRPYVEKQNEEKVRYEARMEDYRRKSAGGGTPPTGAARLSTDGSESDLLAAGGDTDTQGTDRSASTPTTYAQAFTSTSTPNGGNTTNSTTTSTSQQPQQNNVLSVAYQQAVGSPTGGTAQVVYAHPGYTWQ